MTLQIRSSLASALLALLATATAPKLAHAQTVTQSGYTLSTYASGLTANGGVTSMGINLADGTLYYTDRDQSTLRSISPATGHAVTSLGALPPGSVSGAFHPYGSTDIQYFNGNVYAYENNVFAAKPASGAASTSLGSFTGYMNEAGIAAVGTTLYVSSGFTGSTAGQLIAYNTLTGTSAPFTSPVLPANLSSLEFSVAANRLIGAIANSTQYVVINLATHTFLSINTTTTGTALGNFAVDPNGLYLYARDGGTIDRISLANGATSTFVTGLTDTSGMADLVFGKSSSGTGDSLFIGDGTVVREVSGFSGPLAVPEPSTWALLGVGVSGAGVVALRCRARA